MKRKKKDTPYLDFYEKCMEDSLIMPYNKKDGQNNGLCGNFGLKVIKIFSPTKQNEIEYNVTRDGYWACEAGGYFYHGREFNPTRQNIVLLLSCMNDEY